MNRLQIHLRHSRRFEDGCFARLTWTCAPSFHIDVIDPPASHHGHSRLPAALVPHVSDFALTHFLSSADVHRAWLRAWQAEGITFELDESWSRLCHDRLDATLNSFLAVPPVDLDALLWRITQIGNGHGLPSTLDGMGSWSMALWVLRQMVFQRFAPCDVAEFGRCRRALRDLIQQCPIGRLVCWKYRMEHAVIPAIAHDDEAEESLPSTFEIIQDPIAQQGVWLASLVQQPVFVPPCEGIPLCNFAGEKVIWILHLFSGRRRVGDCHWWLEHIGHHLWPNQPIKILSLDTAVHATLGNLAAGSNYERILRMARQGCFAGTLTGPPCETWSAARHLQLEGVAGPRPLQAVQTPWCIFHRTGKELHQVDTGSQLLLKSWQLESEVVLQGGGSLMEHPWENQADDKASVWRTPTHLQLLMSLPGAHRHRVEQFLYGAAGVKPTCIRALHLGDPAVVAAALEEGRELWRPRPQQQLVGRTSEGAFRTSAAKEYPSALCRTLIVALIRGLRTRAVTEGFRTPVTPDPTAEQWMRAAWNAAQDITKESYLPDYQVL